MSVIVENGTLVANANSYVSEGDLTAYCTARGYTLLGNTTQLLVLAADYIESHLFIGDKSTKTQTMMWPRIPCAASFVEYSVGFMGLWADGYPITSSEIPERVKKAQLEVAMNLDKGNDFLTAKGQAVLKEKVGPLEVTYQTGSSDSLYLPRIASLMGPLLRQGGANIAVGRA